MKLIFKTHIKSGGGYMVSEISVLDNTTSDYTQILEFLGYKLLDNGEWFMRTAYNECKTVEIQ